MSEPPEPVNKRLDIAPYVDFGWSTSSTRSIDFTTYISWSVKDRVYLSLWSLSTEVNLHNYPNSDLPFLSRYPNLQPKHKTKQEF